MPCSDGGYATRPGPTEPDYEAMLCGVLTFLEAQPVPVIDDVLENLDYDEIGVSKHKFKSWWNRHKQLDKERREREAEQLRMDKIRRETLAGMTDEQKRALGLD